jgi:hypothetical protein
MLSGNPASFDGTIPAPSVSPEALRHRLSRGFAKNFVNYIEINKNIKCRVIW